MKGASCCEFDGKSMETAKTTEFPNGGKAIVEQILVSHLLISFFAFQDLQNSISRRLLIALFWSVKCTFTGQR